MITDVFQHKLNLNFVSLKTKIHQLVLTNLKLAKIHAYCQKVIAELLNTGGYVKEVICLYLSNYFDVIEEKQ